MKIDYLRSGGFANLSLRLAVDTGDLPPDKAQDLQRLVDAAGFFDLPARIGTEGGAADAFHYRIAISGGGRAHTVEVLNASPPSSLQPLLDHLTAAARTAARERRA
jgi:hypothetical protein